MSGRVWKVRQRSRGDYDLLVDDQLAVLVSLQHGVTRPSLLARRIAAAVAEHHGDRLEGAPGVDWQALGWQDQTEHDGLVDEIARIVQSWSGHRHELPLIGYVNMKKAEQGIPPRPPYTLDQADFLDKIVRRAPAVVEQDLAAEGSAA
jgi:hypothetical protein